LGEVKIKPQKLLARKHEKGELNDLQEGRYFGERDRLGNQTLTRPKIKTRREEGSGGPHSRNSPSSSHQTTAGRVSEGEGQSTRVTGGGKVH